MIDPRITAIVQEGVKKRSVFQANYPYLTLDLSWPSIGALDLYANTLANQKSDILRSELIQFLASYLGVIVYHANSSISDQLDVKLELSSNGEVKLSIKGSPLIPDGQTQMVNVTKALEQALEPESRLRVMVDVSRPYQPPTPRLESLALGLCFGVSPYGKGPWSDKILEESDDLIQNAMATLAHSSARYWKRRFPELSLGQKPYFWFSSLLFPPPGFRETFPATRVSQETVAKCHDLEIAERIMLGTSLLDTPLELAHLAGFAVLYTIDVPEVIDHLTLNRYWIVPHVPLIRSALVSARIACGLRTDWNHSDVNGNSDTQSIPPVPQALEIIEKEIRLGLLPMIWTYGAHLLTPQAQGLRQALGFSHPQVSHQLVEKLLDSQLLPPEYHLQKLFLELKMEELDRAASTIRSLESLLTKPTLLAELHALAGEFYRLSNDMGRSISFFALASRSELTNPHNTIWMWKRFSRALFQSGRMGEALQTIIQALLIDPNDLEAHLLKLDCLNLLGYTTEARAELLALAKFVIKDPRIASRVIEGAVHE